jgi:hypothetical protein
VSETSPLDLVQGLPELTPIKKQLIGSANCKSSVTPKSSTIKGTALEGNEDPRVLLRTLAMPAQNTSIFRLVGQLFGCSGSSERN